MLRDLCVLSKWKQELGAGGDKPWSSIHGTGPHSLLLLRHGSGSVAAGNGDREQKGGRRRQGPLGPGSPQLLRRLRLQPRLLGAKVLGCC